VSHESERAAIIEVGRRLFEKGLVAAAEGNISMRIPGGELVTVSGVSKGFLTADQVVSIDQQGQGPPGARPASSETPMHAAIYRLRPDVNAIVHAHPPTATAFAVARIPLDAPILAESVLLLGSVPVIPYAAPGTADLAEAVAKGLGQGHAALLANHGAITVGRTLAQAHHRMETLEHLARVLLMARLLGEPKELSPPEIEELLGMTSGPYR
jgi:L-fuculose-phosphate aldolase